MQLRESLFIIKSRGKSGLLIDMMLDNVQREVDISISPLRASATEIIPPFFKVRVQWCGKSAPDFW